MGEEPGKNAREEAVANAQSAYDAAKEKLTKLEEEMIFLRGSVTECTSGVAAAEQSLKSYPTDMVEAESKIAEAQNELASFMETMAAFSALKDRTTPPPPPPEPEEPHESEAPAAAE